MNHNSKFHLRILPMVALMLAPIAVLLSQFPGQASAIPQAGDILELPSGTIFLPLVMNGNECNQSFAFIPPDDVANEQAIFEAMNAERAAQGLAPLTLNSDLTQSSRLHSRDMADNNFMEHEGSDGSDAGERIARTCYVAAAWGENIGSGFDSDVAEMMAWWMQSPPHREAILNPDFHDVGVGYAVNPNSEWGHYWTVNFGARE